MALHIKEGDQVIVMSGTNKGKTGKVLSVEPKAGKVVVENVNMVTKHQKPKSQTDLGGIIKKEAPIYACKVMHVCPKCGKPTRIGFKMLENGSKVRVCKQCGETFND
ncbi:MAG: 50S ribosomal protein L24 [Bacillota bacterium]|nr:50S ribosomal protein L24 [Bacillota bacterium]